MIAMRSKFRFVCRMLMVASVFAHWACPMSLFIIQTRKRRKRFAGIARENSEIPQHGRAEPRKGPVEHLGRGALKPALYGARLAHVGGRDNHHLLHSATSGKSRWETRNVRLRIILPVEVEISAFLAKHFYPSLCPS